jgi:hypothetical protein
MKQSSTKGTIISSGSALKPLQVYICQKRDALKGFVMESFGTAPQNILSRLLSRLARDLTQLNH